MMTSASRGFLRFPWTVEAQTDQPAAPVVSGVTGGIEAQLGEPRPVMTEVRKLPLRALPPPLCRFFIGENPETALRTIRVSLDSMIDEAAGFIRARIAQLVGETGRIGLLVHFML